MIRYIYVRTKGDEVASLV